jgi:hypothetical protein
MSKNGHLFRWYSKIGVPSQPEGLLGFYAEHYLGLLKKSIIRMEHIIMILEARFQGKSAIHNRLTPFIPLKGDIAPTIAVNTAKGIGPH